MPTVISCPSCAKQLKVPDELIGRSVKCPGCKETFTAKAASKSAPVEEEIVEKPRKKAAPPPEEEEDEAPRKVSKRRNDDDEDDERPSKRRRRSGAGMQPHRGMLILCLGAGALVGNAILGGVALFLGPVAWYLANQDLKAMDEGVMDPEGRQQTVIGKICGIVATVLLILGVVVGCGFIILWCGLAGALTGAGAAHK